MKVSVVIPTRNEEASIGEVIRSLRGAMMSSPEMTWEVLVVDTASTDRTREIAVSLGARVIDEPERGYGRAYMTGFEHARGEVIVTMDGDGTYPADAVPGLVRMLLEEGLDFITCDRLSSLERGVMSPLHRFGNSVLSMCMRGLFGLKVRDSQSGMWVFRRGILERLHLTSEGMPFSEEIKIEAFSKTKGGEVPITYTERKGEAKLRSFRDGWENLRFLFRKRFRG